MRHDLNYTNDELSARYSQNHKTDDEVWEELREEFEGNSHWRDHLL